MKAEYIEDGKYEFDKYWEELKELRREGVKRVQALLRKAEENELGYDASRNRLYIVQKEEPSPAVSGTEEVPSEAVVFGRTVTYVLIGLGLAGVLAVAVYLLRRRRKSIE